jgi:hypothetical protein
MLLFIEAAQQLRIHLPLSEATDSVSIAATQVKIATQQYLKYRSLSFSARKYR